MNFVGMLICRMLVLMGADRLLFSMKWRQRGRGRVVVNISTRFDHKREIMGILEGSGVLTHYLYQLDG